MKNNFKTYYRSLLLAIISFLPFLSFAQGTQWVTSVNVGNTPNLADWIFDVITTSENNYFCVGFAKENEQNPSDRPDVPAFCLLSPSGTLLADGFIEVLNPADPSEIATGRLYNVVEGNDAYYAVGFIECFNGCQKGILVKVDKTTLQEQHWEVIPQGYATARLNDIVHVSANGDNYLIVSGWVNDGTDRKNWMAAYNYDGSIRSTGSFPHELVTANQPGEVNAMTHAVDPNGNVSIYTASNISANPSGSGLRRPDTDIQLSITSYDPTKQNPFEIASSTPVNSITQRSYSGPNLTDPITLGSDDIFKNFPPEFPPNLYPNSAPYDKYPYGPKYLATPFKREFANCNEPNYLENGLLYVEDFSDGSDDIPFSMIKSGNQLVVSALLNRLIMWGRGATGVNIELGNNDLVYDPQTQQTNVVLRSGVQCSESSDCPHDYDADGYYWGEAYLLFFDINTDGTTTLDKATYLGTMSGGDFIPKVIQTSDGGFAVSGTVTSCPAGLDPVGESEHMMIIKLDANGDVIWREHENGPSEGACGFAITETPDGGIIVAGNTEGGGEEDFCIIKFGSDCDYGIATVLPNSGNDYVLAATEIWDTDMTVKAHVVVPTGITLRIQGTTAAKITVGFADSKEVFNYKNRSPIGITVQKGGSLIVSNAILTGFDCSGTPKMWDGINAEGDPNLPQTNANQGFASFYNSDILNARQGTVTTAVWCGTPAPIVKTYAGTGSQGTTHTSALYHGGPFGGAKIHAINSRWIDNKRSAIFMKYQHNLDKSWFFNCDFISNGPLADPNELLQATPNDLDHNEARGTSTHVSIWSTRVEFSSCDFLGSTDIIPDFRPFGIEGDDPKIIASGGQMKDLKIGIECRSLFGSILGTVHASGITLDNVVQGINLRNSTADIITGCHFMNIPSPNTFQGLSPVGIFGQFNKGSIIQSNDFHGSDPSKPSWGVVEHNTLNQGCDIKENEFFDARIGNQFEGNNGQLFARCNDYTDMGFSGWSAVLSGFAGNLPAQGSPIINQPKADNEFFDFCDGSSDIHIYSEFPFSYFDKIGNPHPVDEDCVSDIVNFSKTADPSLPNCYVMIPPCPNPPCDYLSQYYQSPGTIPDRNIAIRGLVHTGFDSTGADLPARYQDVLTLLQYRNQPEDRVLLIGSLASMDRYVEAQTENNLLSSATTESSAFKAYMGNIFNANAEIIALPIGNYNTAMSSLSADNVSTRGLAENLRYFTEGNYIPLIAINAEAAGAERPAADRQQSSVIEPLLFVSTAPNPFQNEVTFDLTNIESECLLIISDVLGRVLLSENLFGGQLFKWHALEPPTGQYFYQIRTHNGIVKNGSVMKIKQ